MTPGPPPANILHLCTEVAAVMDPPSRSLTLPVCAPALPASIHGLPSSSSTTHAVNALAQQPQGCSTPVSVTALVGSVTAPIATVGSVTAPIAAASSAAGSVTAPVRAVGSVTAPVGAAGSVVAPARAVGSLSAPVGG